MRIKKLPKAILLDIDNTMYDYGRSHDIALSVCADYVSNTLGLSSQEFHKYYDKARKQIHLQLKGTASSHNRMLYFQRLLELSGYGGKITKASDLFNLYWDKFIDNIVLYEGVYEFLDYIRQMGIKSVLVTDLTVDVQLKKIARLNLEGKFDALVTSEEAGFDKPHQAIFDLALEKINCVSKNIWVIGDSLSKDMVGAKKIGALGFLKCSQAKADNQDIIVDYKFSSFMDLIGLIKEINRSDNQFVDSDLEDLTSISRLYGEDFYMVQAGGGNTSVKLKDCLWVKKSGIKLKDISGVDDFVPVDLTSVLSLIGDSQLIRLANNERDEKVSQLLLAARINSNNRPSIETFLHALLKDRFVVHTHPIYVNALVCSLDGENIASELFNQNQYLWVPFALPGYPLAQLMYDSLAKRSIRPNIIFLQNHGVIVSASNINEIKSITSQIIDKLCGYFGPYRMDKANDFKESVNPDSHNHFRKNIADALKEKKSHFVWVDQQEVHLLSEPGDFQKQALSGCLYPDHVVYCGQSPLVLDKSDTYQDILKKVEQFRGFLPYNPKYIVINGMGILVLARSDNEFKTRQEMLLAHVRTMRIMIRKSKPFFIDKKECSYLENWEAEKYRQKLSTN